MKTAINLCFTLFIAFPLFSQEKHLPNYNAFLNETSTKSLNTESEALDLVLHPDRIQTESRLGVPTFVWTRTDLIQNRHVMTAQGTATQTLSLFSELYRYNQDILDTAKVKYTHDLGAGVAVKFKQVIHDLEVYGAETNVAMSNELTVHGITGYLFPHSIPPTFKFIIDEKQAITLAFEDLEEERISTQDLEKVSQRLEYQYYGLKPQTRSSNQRSMRIPTRIKRILFGMSDHFEPAYYLELNIGDSKHSDSDYYAYIISASNGELLLRENLTVRDSFTYNAWASDASGLYVPFDGPQGNAASPHPTGTPDGHQEPFISPNMITLESIAPVNDPWLPASATETVGNNVDAYIDRFGGDGYQPTSGDFRATTTSPNTFDYAFNHTVNPETDVNSQNAAVVQLFYVNNYLHDVYYEAGFDEIAGNAQEDNFGRGGQDGDVMHCQGQDGSGTNNANMSTPADGANPRMQMYIFDGSNPNRDGTIDNGISGHEWGHYIHHRLIPAQGTTQTGSMGEGWGDFIALVNTVEEGDLYEGVYATGGYSLYHVDFGPSGFDENYYFGIRRFPYSTNFAKNGLTFRHIGGATSSLPSTPISPQGWENSGNSEVHNAGEIWCSMLWECYHDLIVSRTTQRTAFDDARKDMMKFIVLSMKLSPSATTFTEARDAMLLAVAVSSPTEFSIFSDAFARRGIGDGAVSPARTSSSLSGVVESFTPIPANGSITFLSAELDDSVSSCDSDGILDAGETGILTISVRNEGYGELTATTASLSSIANLQYSNGGIVSFPSGNPGETVVGTIQVTLQNGPGSTPIQIDMLLNDTSPGVSNVNASESFLSNYDVIQNHFSTDTVEHGENIWQTSAMIGTQLWQVVEDGTNQSATHSWFVPDITSSLDSYLETPDLTVNATGDFIFSFYHRFSFESGSWDGGVLELSSDGGINWIDIGASASPTYNGVITSNPASPISERPAYVNDIPGYPAFSQVTVNLGTTYSGQSIRVRFRMGCDGATGGEGWYIDDLSFPTIPPIFSTQVDESASCGSCFSTSQQAYNAMLISMGSGEWPEPHNILHYLEQHVNNICSP